MYDDDQEVEALEIDLEVAHIGEILERHGVAPTEEMVVELWTYMDSLRIQEEP